MKLRYGISTFALVIATAFAAPSCGGNDQDAGCDDGATRSCVGPGACEGGQICRQGRWSDCVCEGANSEAGGAGGAAAGASAHSSGAGGENANGGGGAATSGNGGAGGETSPCPPADQLLFDCSGECAPDKPCYPLACHVVDIDVPGDGTPVYVRTARVTSGNQCDCGPLDWPDYVMTVRFAQSNSVRVEVEAPWSLLRRKVGADTCTSEPGTPLSKYGSDHCDVIPPGLGISAVIGIGAPSAEPATVRFRAVRDSDRCE
jgi:hypothetical protein